MPAAWRIESPEEIQRPIFEYDGKIYMHRAYEIWVWRCSSNKTGRMHWVKVSNAPDAVLLYFGPGRIVA